MPIGGVRLLAHRGGPATAPENTLEAVSRSRAEGADGVELDVRLSADGEPFLFHDDDGLRLTGRRGPVCALAWREIRELRVLGRAKIPHLEEALAAFEDWPGGELTLDLHQDSFPLAEEVARRVAASPARDRVRVLHFYSGRAFLLRVRQTRPQVPLSVMPGPPWNVAASLALRPAELCLGWDAPWTRRLYRLASRLWDVPGLVARARRAGVRVSMGVANAEEDVRYVLGQGADGVWTDDLPLARRALQDYPRLR